MLKPWRFLSPSDDSGGTGTKDGDAGGDGGTEAKNAGADGSKMTPDEQITKLTADLATKTDDYNRVTTKLGKQSEQVGVLREFHTAMKNPETAQTMIAKIAKDVGLNVNFGKAAETDLTKLFESDDPNERMKGVQAMVDARESKGDPEIDAKLEKIAQGQFAAQYEDWNDKADVRATLAVAETTGKMSKDELLHMAARGMSMADVITAAEARGAESYRKELEKKNKEQIDGGGGRTKNAGDAEKGAKYFRTVLELGKNLRP